MTATMDDTAGGGVTVLQLARIAEDLVVVGSLRLRRSRPQGEHAAIDAAAQWLIDVIRRELREGARV